MIYRIPEHNIERLKKRIGALQRKADKLRSGRIHFEVIGEEYERAGSSYIKIVIVNLEGEPPIIDGWRFLAIIQHHVGDRNIVRTLGDVELDPAWWTAGPQCQHCGYKRTRRDTYIVQCTKTGTLKQVGSTCLKDFVGHTDPAQYAKYLEQAEELTARAATYDPFDSQANRYIPLLRYLAWTASEIRRNGWVSKSRAREELLYPTATAAYDDMISGRSDYAPTDADQGVAKEALEWVRAGWAAQEDSELTGYQRNVVSVAGQDYIEARETGIAASIIPAFLKASRPKNKGGWIGRPGRQVEVPVTVTFNREYDGRWGPYQLVKFITDKGNALKWFGTGKLARALKAGDKLTIRATVKKHDKWRGQRETLITRVRKIA